MRRIRGAERQQAFLERKRGGTGTEEQMNQDSKKIRSIAAAGMLAAVTLVLGLTNIGIIPIPPANVTTMHIPVIIDAILRGPRSACFWVRCLA